jgi:integrase
VASSWVRKRTTSKGDARYHVLFVPGGREATQRYAGSFRTMREARARRDYIAGELAALRMPDLSIERDRTARTLTDAAERWRSSRLDVSDGTQTTYRVALGRVLPRHGKTAVTAVDASWVADLVAELHAEGFKRQTIRKTIGTLAMVLEHEGVQPNPARDRLTVKLPREAKRIVQPPTAAHIAAAVRLMPAGYRLATIVLDGTGMRVGELEALTWGDVDEPRGRWRIATSKTGVPRWVIPSPVLLEAVLALCPRDDRHADRRVFEQVTGDKLRTAMTRACTGAGVPAFSPHGLRHRRVSLLHLAGVPWARIGEAVGHDLVTAARTYSHVMADEAELDYAGLLR